MIGYLSGLIIDKDEKSLLVLAGSVGYRVFASNKLLSECKVDQKIQVYIHTSVKEDDISLYGFTQKEEMHFFEQLISVSGIGPKMGMEILSTPMNMTQNAILAGDIAVLTKIKGLGKKTAERLVLELKNKVVPIELTPGSSEGAGIDQDAVLALTSLGYDRFEVVKFLSKNGTEAEGTEALVKAFLKDQ